MYPPKTGQNPMPGVTPVTPPSSAATVPRAGYNPMPGHFPKPAPASAGFLRTGHNPMPSQAQVPGASSDTPVLRTGLNPVPVPPARSPEGSIPFGASVETVPVETSVETVPVEASARTTAFAFGPVAFEYHWFAIVASNHPDGWRVFDFGPDRPTSAEQTASIASEREAAHIFRLAWLAACSTST